MNWYLYHLFPGVEAQTLTVWNQANNYKIPRAIYLNKMDKPKANVQQCLLSIENKLKTKPLLINFPLIDGNKVIGVVDIIRMEKLVYDFKSNCDGQKFDIKISYTKFVYPIFFSGQCPAHPVFDVFFFKILKFYI